MSDITDKSSKSDKNIIYKMPFDFFDENEEIHSFPYPEYGFIMTIQRIDREDAYLNFLDMNADKQPVPQGIKIYNCINFGRLGNKKDDDSDDKLDSNKYGFTLNCFNNTFILKHASSYIIKYLDIELLHIRTQRRWDFIQYKEGESS